MERRAYWVLLIVAASRDASIRGVRSRPAASGLFEGMLLTNCAFNLQMPAHVIALEDLFHRQVDAQSVYRRGGRSSSAFRR
jgi:hypothetical protein